MPAAAVQSAIAARLAGSWTTTPIRDLNVMGEAPDDGSPFVEVQYPVANENQITVGSPGANVFRESGAFRIILFVRRGVGVQEGLGWMDTLRALFRGQNFSGVTTYAPSPPALDDRNDDGNYWILSTSVPYYFDQLA